MVCLPHLDGLQLRVVEVGLQVLHEGLLPRLLGPATLHLLRVQLPPRQLLYAPLPQCSRHHLHTQLLDSGFSLNPKMQH